MFPYFFVFIFLTKNLFESKNYHLYLQRTSADVTKNVKFGDDWI